MTPASYQALNGGIAFVPPAAPAPNPIIIPGATAAVVAKAMRQHEGHIKACRLMRQVQTKLRSVLCHEELLCSNRTVCELLGHMSTVYGDFTDTKRKEIMKQMQVPWNLVLSTTLSMRAT
jgi:hypothetical protein